MAKQISKFHLYQNVRVVGRPGILTIDEVYPIRRGGKIERYDYECVGMVDGKRQTGTHSEDEIQAAGSTGA